MCGRFALTLPHEAMARLFEARIAGPLMSVPRYNIAPTQEIICVASTDTDRRLEPMRWGFLPHWATSPADGPLLINARAETLADKPAFRQAARKRRCLIPASGFYEWQKQGRHRLPWYVTQPGAEVMAFGGIWQDWTGSDGQTLRTVAIVTTPANADIAPVHDRAPLIIARADWPLWLGEAGKGAARLMHPPPDGTLTAWRVSERVNSGREDDPGLVVPIDTGAGAPAPRHD